MLSPLPRRSGWAYCFAHSPQPYQPSPKGLSGRPAPRPFRGLLGVHSRYGLHTRAVTVYRDTLSEGFSHFVTSMTAPVASGWSGCRVGLAPTGKRRLSTAHTQSGPFRFGSIALRKLVFPNVIQSHTAAARCGRFSSVILVLSALESGNATVRVHHPARRRRGRGAALVTVSKATKSARPMWASPFLDRMLHSPSRRECALTNYPWLSKEVVALRIQRQVKTAFKDVDLPKRKRFAYSWD